MSPIEYAAFWAFVIALGGMADWLWVERIRPALAPTFGWPDLEPDYRIPPIAWLGAMGFVAVIGFWSYVGALAGLT